MKKTALALISLVIVLLAASCDNTETYADKKNAERAAIDEFITKNSIQVISQSEFEANGCKTDTAKNQYVYLDNSGVYMQIVNEGCGAKMKDGESCTVLSKYWEYNIEGDSLQTTDWGSPYYLETMTVSKSGSTYTASFSTSNSNGTYCMMYYCYGSSSVPSGWLVPLDYIKLGRPTTADEDIARVKLIVPHSQGQQYATQNVYPCFYNLTYERGR